MRSKSQGGYRKTNKKANTNSSSNWKLYFFLFLFFGLIGYYNRINLMYYLGFKSHKMSASEWFDAQNAAARNQRILHDHDGMAVGIDVSEFQDKINWDEVKNLEGNYPIDFVLVRATAGSNKKDLRFTRNWKALKRKDLIRGAYHYYRPNENSLDQAKLFIAAVDLQKGDLPPVLDIEKLPKSQSLDSLKVGLQRWLNAVEKHYGVKPIIYTGEKYYDDFLKDDFSDYLFWIANYNGYRTKIDSDWLFWQFTEKARIKGFTTFVDVNVFNGDLEQLKHITIE